MRIKVLPDKIANQIAAGEVVDRPASVVRELVDNAVDAGASDICVRLLNGGRESISVSDDGCGMARDDAILAFERHATSKLSEHSDLLAIETLGFRGEALPSIAAVSQVTLRTRNQDSDRASEVIFHAGKLKDVRTAAAPPGTEVEVRNLFFNTPARRRFLKSERSEEIRIKRWLSASALGFPAVRYRLFFDERQVLNLPAVNSQMERARLIFSGSLLEVDLGVDDILVRGLIGHPAQSQSVSSEFVILVNGRVVQDRAIIKAVKDGFGFSLKPQEFPLGFISLQLPCQQVDINIHPQKSEVRFLAPQKVFSAVKSAVGSVLREFKGPLDPYQILSRQSQVETFSQNSGAEIALSTPEWLIERDTPQTAPTLQEGTVSVPPALRSRLPDAGFKFSQLKLIGQFLGCYLLCEHQEQVYVIDMHAAHERYNFNLIKNSFSKDRRPGQKLLIPQRLRLDEEAAYLLASKIDLLERFGFELEFVGKTDLLISSVPAFIKDGRAAEIVRDLADLPEELESSGILERQIERVAASMACHASVRSGDILQREEVYALFEALDRSEFSAACPHGRPVIVNFKRPQVESWFGRDR
ncbi:MAG: DNA mismatch repair endonuclease MutL [Proteobacteria bacterium]|nr:MAG: DNA mismatch repair endonuclease MutL [Pseudomonadota bacterium]